MTQKKPARPSPAECPVCGGDVPPQALACPHCGADERSGWNEEGLRYDGIDLPDDAFEDAPAPVTRKSRISSLGGVPIFWWAVGVGMTALIIYLVTIARF